MRQSIWERLTIDILRKIEDERNALQGAQEHLRRMEEEYEKVKGPVLSTTPVSGGMLNKEEERRLNNMALRVELEDAIDARKRNIGMFEDAWKKLTANEQTALTYFFISRPHNYIDRLIELFNCERTTVYRIKDDALYRMTMFMYGKYM